MIWKRKQMKDILGVPLEDLMKMLKPTTLKTTMKGNALIARHEHYSTRIELLPPESQVDLDSPIRAVVRVVTELPDAMQALVQDQEVNATAAYNAYSALGALYMEQGKVYIGSRLTIYEAEDAWSTLHLPLLMITSICGAEAILGAIRRLMTGEQPSVGASAWTGHDFAQARGLLSRVCLCTGQDTDLTAEFSLGGGSGSAAFGDQQTALFTMTANQPHPALGGGLFSLLEMPHQMQDEQQVKKLCFDLNNMEMGARDLPPHFGAWCPGKMGNNPAYVSFMPNSLHVVPGIASNAAAWAMGRAEWANAQLSALYV